MTQQTRLGVYGGPRQPYGSFAGKVESGGEPVGTEVHTRLGAYGGPRQRYGSFAGKVESGGVPVGTEVHTRLGAYGGARQRYGSFAGKGGTPIVSPATPDSYSVGGTAPSEIRKRRRSLKRYSEQVRQELMDQLIMEDEELIFAIARLIGENNGQIK